MIFALSIPFFIIFIILIFILSIEPWEKVTKVDVKDGQNE